MLYVGSGNGWQLNLLEVFTDLDNRALHLVRGQSNVFILSNIIASARKLVTPNSHEQGGLLYRGAKVVRIEREDS
jgi:hypothetical protein